jgi:hypothetical protein
VSPVFLSADLERPHLRNPHFTGRDEFPYNIYDSSFSEVYTINYYWWIIRPFFNIAMSASHRPVFFNLAIIITIARLVVISLVIGLFYLISCLIPRATD